MTATPSGYDDPAVARWASEPRKRADSPGRSPFARDRARVLHSYALRRLAAKTQVVAVGSGDFPRTRLTHSLECAQIGRELGAALGCDPDLVDAACLAHDIGHPPFGHNGEAALDVVAAGCGGFEGNAQSLRLLTRLEAKVPGAGLNLTRATLDATLKYPWRRAEDGAPTRGKFGVYAADEPVFAWIRAGAPPRRPCLEAQVMDWADDVAYSVHDLEDGLHAGLIEPRRLRGADEMRAVVGLTIAEYSAPGSVTADELLATFARLLALEFWPTRFDGSLQATAEVKNMTSELIGRFCGAAQRATLETAALGRPAQRATLETAALGRSARRGGKHLRPLTRYAADLVIPRVQRLECDLLKGVTAHYVMSRAGAAAAQAREREVIAELADALLTSAPASLDPLFRPAFCAAADDAGRLRVVIDQIASLTDTSALAWHARLCR